jgi:hypothetical protein
MVLWEPRSCALAEMIIFPTFWWTWCLYGSNSGRRNTFLLSRPSRLSLGLQFSSYSIDIGGSFPGVRRPGHEVDRGTPSSVKVKNEWSLSLLPSMLSCCGQGHIYRNLKPLLFNLKKEVACSIDSMFSIYQIIQYLSPKGCNNSIWRPKKVKPHTQKHIEKSLRCVTRRRFRCLYTIFHFS